MLKRITIYIIIIGCLIGSISDAKPPKGYIQPNLSTNVDDDTYIDANLILMFVTNHGNFGRDLSGMFGYDYGTWYPYTGNPSDISSNINSAGEKSPLYAAGIWLGGKVNNQIRVAISEYESEYVPGPMLSGTFQNDKPEFRTYKLYSDSMANNPNSDYLNWPSNQGAPVDGNGNPKIAGDQMLWSVYNDADADAHNLQLTEPLGVEIQQTVYAYNTLEEAIFFKYKLYNKSSNNITDMYFSLWVDPDIGDMYDDLVGCDTLENVMYCYNSSNNDFQYGSPPPAIGFKIVYGPLVPSFGDTAIFDYAVINNYKNLPMTSFNKFITGTDPNDAQETYNYMMGLKSNGTPYTYNSQQLKYVHSGNPIFGLGDFDNSEDDKRMMASCGPFDFNPGDSQSVVIKMAVSQGGNRLASISSLLYALHFPLNFPTDIVSTELGELPDNFILSQNYPNPFNPTTTIHYNLPVKSDVSLEIYNITGQKVKILINKKQPAGSYSVKWDGTNQSSKKVSSGMYFYKLSAGDFVNTKKMILLK